MIKKILLIGPQASGKGTQAELLSKKFNLPIFSTGNILRQKMQSGDDLGNELRSIINSGNLAPDDLVNKIIAEKIQTDGQNGYILDGYPRNTAQAEFLSTIDELTHVFEISIPDELAIKRVSGRRTCPQCQTVYHIETNPPTVQNICDKDGATLVIREDETEEALKKRLHTYHDQTEPLLDYYKSKNILHSIDGTQTIPEVNTDVLQILGE